MKSLLLMSLLFSGLTFAQEGYQTAGLFIDESLATIMSELNCLKSDSQERSKRLGTTSLTARPEIIGKNYYGVTSEGDIAVLRDNNKLDLYICERDLDTKDAFLSQIAVNSSDSCHVDEISALTFYISSKNAVISLNFRPLQFGEGSSLCSNLEAKKVDGMQIIKQVIEANPDLYENSSASQE